MLVDIDNLNRYTYNGEDYDFNTGLQYLRARYYNTSTGGFISQDTYLGQTIVPLTQKTDGSKQAGHSLESAADATPGVGGTPKAPDLDDTVPSGRRTIADNNAAPAPKDAARPKDAIAPKDTTPPKSDADTIRGDAGDTSKGVGADGDNGGSGTISNLSNKALKHPMNDHMPENMQINCHTWTEN